MSMDRETAARLMEIYTRAGAVLNEAAPLLQDMPLEEREKYFRPVVKMMCELWTDLQHPIVRLHPELDPDGDRFKKGANRDG